MLVMMVVMLTIVLFSHEHMGMMGQGSDHVEGSTGAEQQAKTEQTENSAPSVAAEHQR